VSKNKKNKKAEKTEQPIFTGSIDYYTGQPMPNGKKEEELFQKLAAGVPLPEAVSDLKTQKCADCGIVKKMSHLQSNLCSDCAKKIHIEIKTDRQNLTNTEFNDKYLSPWTDNEKSSNSTSGISDKAQKKGKRQKYSKA
jgi:hypothetical protein